MTTPPPRLAELTRLVLEHQDYVCAVAYAATGDRALSEDVAQETFLVAWRDQAALRDPAKLRPWLGGIARNLGRKARRRRGRIAEAASELGCEADQEDALLAREREEAAWRALRALPETYREALVLHYRGERPAREIAALLGTSEEAIHQRLSRGRSLLRAEVRRLLEDTARATAPTAAFLAAVLAAASSQAAPAPAPAPGGSLAPAGRPRPVGGGPAWRVGPTLLDTLGLLAAGALAVTATVARPPGVPAGPTSTVTGVLGERRGGEGPRGGTPAEVTTAAGDSPAPQPGGVPSGAGADPWSEPYAVGVEGPDLPEAWLPAGGREAILSCVSTIGGEARLDVEVSLASPAAPVVRVTGRPEGSLRFLAWHEGALVGPLDEEAAVRALAGAPFARLAGAADPRAPRSLEHYLDGGEHAVVLGPAAAAPPLPDVLPDGARLETGRFLERCVEAVVAAGGRHEAGPAVRRFAIVITTLAPPGDGPDDPADLGGSARGPDDAPVVVVAYLAPGCGPCVEAIEALDELATRFDGRIRILVKHVPRGGDATYLAAEAILAAGDQGRFWEMQDLVLGHQGVPRRVELVAAARSLGLDVPRFEAALRARAFREALAAQVAEADALEVRGIPTFRIGRRGEATARTIVGAFRTHLAAAIKEALGGPR